MQIKQKGKEKKQMKKFEAPEMEIEKFGMSDVITASGCPEEVLNCPVDLGL